jgi:hypothetical protein
MVESTKRKIVSFAVTVSIVLSLLALAQPTTAALITVSGPEEVTRPDAFTVATTVTLRSDEPVDVQHFRLTLSPESNDAQVTVDFDAEGNILAVSPERGVLTRGGVRVTHLRQSLTITPRQRDGDVGYGYGYGYGYGSGDRQFAFDVELDSKAFKDGRYVIGAGVAFDGDADADVVTSGQTTVEVVSPSADPGPPDESSGRPNELPFEVPNDVQTALHRLIRMLVSFLQSGSVFPRGG